MLWDRDKISRNVEDRRAQGPVGRAGMGIFGLLPFFLRFGWKGLVVFGLIAGGMYWYGGGAGGGGETNPQRAATSSPEENRSALFVSEVLDDSQSTWSRVMPGGRYQEAKLILFRGSTGSGCGVGQSQMGPFYCPLDHSVYIDLSFFDDLRARLGAPGDFAQAYVIAHEIGHHVQNLLGTSDKVHKASAVAQKGAGGLSVKLELQADCFAGIWAHDAERRKILEMGDVEEALAAAAAIGDDRLQKAGQGHVSPETWSHGSSEQRAYWLRRGMKSGDPAECNTFAEQRP